VVLPGKFEGAELAGRAQVVFKSDGNQFVDMQGNKNLQ